MIERSGENPAGTAHESANEFSTGTTIVALGGDDGVVLGADARVSLGGRFVTNRSARKVEPIGERAAVAFSGGVSDAQSVVDQLRTERQLYKLDHGRPMPTDALATTAGRLIRNGQFRSIGLLLGGVDESAVYWIDGGGGVMRDAYAANGSGMQLAYGALEGAYEPARPVSDLRPIAADALAAAAERDVASGDGMTITTITGEGLSERRTNGLGREALAGADGASSAPDTADEEVA
ncbi:20S proteasome subunits A/B [Halovivax asiaticus JCM 14624]|uniref:proteasome endopeptidase complex n=1 Tax=Halovivax asiaticus JCM 14624 TaxID=1227490 RepID=M0BBW1_9EURY|nr:20S proteasome subunits A/B [Halovivax asiaticus]ELZ08401.1 20S proteasome subunits A/B [Halovivax asiaticus JCM 14624]